MAGTGVSYLTYEGIGQEKIVTLKHEETVRSNSYHGSSGGGFYSGGGGYSHGK